MARAYWNTVPSPPLHNRHGGSALAGRVKHTFVTYSDRETFLTIAYDSLIEGHFRRHSQTNSLSRARLMIWLMRPFDRLSSAPISAIVLPSACISAISRLRASASAA